MILVVGATGLLGAEICRCLRGRGHVVRALVRRSSPKAAAIGALGVETVFGDLKDRASLDTACREAAAVITTANTMAARQPGDTLKTVDRDGQLALVEAAKRAGALRFLYVSVSPNLPADNPFVLYKREVERAIRASGMTWTILQPSAFMEIHAGAPLGWDFAAGRARIMGSGRAPMSYISLNDVAQFAALAIDDAKAANRDLHITGPEPLTAADAVRIAERVTGRSFTVQRVPARLLKILSILLRPVAPIPSSLMALAVGLDRGEILDMTRVLQDFPVRLTTFEEYVRSMIERGTPQPFLAP